MARYAVIILTGPSSPEVVRSVGPFPTPDDAQLWCEEEGLPLSPSTDEWAAIVPQDMPAGGDA